MSTRSIVGRTEGDGFAGRYVHWDGYPMYQGPILWAWVRAHLSDRDGLRAELDAFVDEHTGYNLLLRAEASAPSALASECYCHARGDGFDPTDRPLTVGDPVDLSDAEWAWSVDAEAARLALWVPSGGGWQLRFVWYVDDEEPDWAVVERTAKERPLRGRAGGQL